MTPVNLTELIVPEEIAFFHLNRGVIYCAAHDVDDCEPCLDLSKRVMKAMSQSFENGRAFGFQDALDKLRSCTMCEDRPGTPPLSMPPQYWADWLERKED